MNDSVYPQSTRAIAEQRKRLAPETHDAFQAFSKLSFAMPMAPADCDGLAASS
ncbi:MAG TPA: hypothetical protein VFL45_01405 [Gammaproteobacteria bacterium]|nr:hypothetical protein [Gammaproteobacteria bacterium]